MRGLLSQSIFLRLRALTILPAKSITSNLPSVLVFHLQNVVRPKFIASSLVKLLPVIILPTALDQKDREAPLRPK